MEILDTDEQAVGSLGNTDVQRMIMRKRLEVGSKEEELPAVDDPRLQSIQMTGGFPLLGEFRAHMERIFSHDFKMYGYIHPRWHLLQQRLSMRMPLP